MNNDNQSERPTIPAPVNPIQVTHRYTEHCYECECETEHMNDSPNGYHGCVPCRITNDDVNRWLKIWSVENTLKTR